MVLPAVLMLPAERRSGHAGVFAVILQQLNCSLGYVYVSHLLLNSALHFLTLPCLQSCSSALQSIDQNCCIKCDLGNHLQCVIFCALVRCLTMTL